MLGIGLPLGDCTLLRGRKIPQALPGALLEPSQLARLQNDQEMVRCTFRISIACLRGQPEIKLSDFSRL